MKNTTNFKPHIADAALLFGAVDEPSACEAFLVMEEIWKDVKGYEGYYQVSNLGRVRSLPRNKGKRVYGGKILKQVDRGNGYLCISLSKNNQKSPLISVHQLVAQAFIDNPNNLPQVNHIDGNKQNNRADNLEWSNASMQAIHAFSLGLRKQTKGADDPKSKTVYQYTLGGELVNVWGSGMEAERNGYCSSSISSCCRGYKVKTHKGYVWSFIPLNKCDG